MTTTTLTTATDSSTYAIQDALLNLGLSPRRGSSNAIYAALSTVIERSAENLHLFSHSEIAQISASSEEMPGTTAQRTTETALHTLRDNTPHAEGFDFPAIPYPSWLEDPSDEEYLSNAPPRKKPCNRLEDQRF